MRALAVVLALAALALPSAALPSLGDAPAGEPARREELAVPPGPLAIPPEPRAQTPAALPPLAVVPESLAALPARLALPDPYPSLSKLPADAPLPPTEREAVAASVEPAPAAASREAPPYGFPRDEPVLVTSQLAVVEPAPGPAPPPAPRVEAAAAAPGPSGAPVAEAATAAGLLLLAAALYVRLAAPAVLGSPARRRILELVRADPGCTTGTVARALGVDYKTAAHHLRMLRHAGCIMVLEGPQERLFVAGDLPPSQMRARVALRARSARALLDALAEREARAADLARALGVSEATASVQLRRLQAAGLATRGADGHWRRAAA